VFDSKNRVFFDFGYWPDTASYGLVLSSSLANALANFAMLPRRFPPPWSIEDAMQRDGLPHNGWPACSKEDEE